jgi:hypothetical protein
MQSNKWGPDAWSLFHTMSFNYPLDPKQCDKDDYKSFFKTLTNILPCNICRKSYSFFYEKFPIDEYLDDRNGVVFWLFTLHNIVNLKLDKPTAELKDVVLKYENFRARCGNIDTTNKQKLEECQKPLKWNVEMEYFVDETMKKYNNMTVKKIADLLKNNPEREEIKNIIKNTNKSD